MTLKVDRRSTPVWRCLNLHQPERCSAQWATWDEGTTCPFCHVGLGERTGFTYGDIADAADKFGFGGALPVHVQEPVPDLVQLSTLPQLTWIGLPVFHPCSQEETPAKIIVNWLHYDVGVVLEVYPDTNSPNDFVCRFVTSTCALQYQPSNLWVPKVLAERILGRRS